MTPTRPYFLRAMYDWITDNQCTPFLVVDATVPLVKVPEASVEDGQIVLNIAAAAVADFAMDNHSVSFNARFAGEPFAIFVPMAAVLGLYASENGQGMAFPEEPAYEAAPEEETSEQDSGEKKPGLSAVTDDAKDSESTVTSEKKTSNSKKKPSLKVIK